jgi:hypothetical protein
MTHLMETPSFEAVKQEEHRTAITDSYTIVHSAGSSSDIAEWQGRR